MRPSPDWSTLANTRVLLDASYYACQRNHLTVLAVNGHADEVWRRALAGQPFVGARATIAGHEVRFATQLDADPSVLTMDDAGPAGTTLTITTCEG